MTNSFSLRTVIQRVNFAEVKIEGVSQGVIEKGLLILFAVGGSHETSSKSPSFEDPMAIVKTLQPRLEKLAEKILALRIFNDGLGKMNLSVKDINGGIYIVSQFTLFADCGKGTRPSFMQSAKPQFAQPIYNELVQLFKDKHINHKVFTGKFAHEMQVNLCNDGPVTIVLEG